MYRVAFVEDETFLNLSTKKFEKVFQIIIQKNSNTIEPFDSKVSSTIEHIVEGFFKNEQNALVYICSDENDKAFKRHLIFERWYKKSKQKSNIIKINKEIKLSYSPTDFQILYTSFLFHKDNKQFKELIEVYNKLDEFLQNK